MLLHGLGVSGEVFQPIWDQLAAHHHLLIPDLRGMGHSAGLPGPASVEQVAADVASLLQSQHVAPADVVGVSQGWITPSPNNSPGGIPPSCAAWSSSVPTSTTWPRLVSGSRRA